MRSAEFLKRCLDAGMPMDMAMLALKAFDAEAPLVAAEALEDGRAKARERQARHRASRDGAGMSRDKRDSETVTDVTSDNVMSRDKRDEPHARVGDIYLTTEVTGLAAAVVCERDASASDWPEGDARAWSVALVALAQTSRLDPSRQPGLTTTLGRLMAWKTAGASWEFDVVPTVCTMAQKRGPPIASWKFFEAAVLQQAADNRQALTLPEARNDQPSQNRKSPRDDKIGRMLAGAMASLDG